MVGRHVISALAVNTAILFCLIPLLSLCWDLVKQDDYPFLSQFLKGLAITVEQVDSFEITAEIYTCN